MLFNPNQALLSFLMLFVGIIIGAGALYLISSGFIQVTTIGIGIAIGFTAFVMLSVILNPYL